MSNGAHDDSGKQGMILIVVLWAVSLMTLTVVALSALSQKSLSLAGVETDRMRTELALEAGTAAAEALIMAEKPENRAFFDGKPLVLDIGSGRIVEIGIRDASGLVDLNRADPVLIEQFIKENIKDPDTAGVLIKAILAMRPEPKPGSEQADNDGNGSSQTRQPLQTTSGQASSRQPAANQAESEKRPPVAIVSIGQLFGIEGIPDETLDKLLPLITLYSSQGGKVNPLAAPSEVLLSIPGLGNRELAIFDTARKRRQWQTTEVQTALTTLEKFALIGEARSFVISVKLVSGPGLIAGSSLTASIVSDDSGKEAFQVMAWSW